MHAAAPIQAILVPVVPALRQLLDTLRAAVGGGNPDHLSAFERLLVICDPAAPPLSASSIMVAGDPRAVLD